MVMYIARSTDAYYGLRHARAVAADNDATLVDGLSLAEQFEYPYPSKGATQLEMAVLRQLLADKVDVVVTDYRNDGRRIARFVAAAAEYGVSIRYRDYSSDVGPKVMERNYKRLFPPQGARKAIIVDTDGTVALHKHRSPYDTSLYHTDEPNVFVAETVHAMMEAGYLIIGVSGRSEEFREVTEKWWADNIGFVPELFLMRAIGDDRDDALVKYELYAQHIGPRYDVVGVIDDRPRVLRMWRRVGLPTLQVGDGKEF